MTKGSPFWAPEIHADRRAILLDRVAITRALRDYFTELGFIEVETAIMQVSPGNETHVHAFKTELSQPPRRDRRFLRCSPEFACKKLMAAGERRVVEFAKVFRNGERGPLHHPEFTMIEWYRAHGRYELMMEDALGVIARAAETVETRLFSYRGLDADPCAPPERFTVAEAFERFANINLDEALPPDGPPDRDRFRLAAYDAGVRIAADDTWRDVFSRVLSEKIEPHLGVGQPTILDEYPTLMSALARPVEADPRFAERFEIYVCGVELANGFGELRDPREQRRRLAEEMAEKERIYHERYPIDDDFIAALHVMPETSGVALGLDRLVMLATGAQHIEQVMWAPVAEL